MWERVVLVLRNEWDAHPPLIALLLVLGVVYVGATTVGARRGRRPLVRHPLAFLAGLSALFLTLASPLHHLSDDHLFSAHMLQHQLLTLVVPPLLLWGTPPWMAAPILRAVGLDRVGQHRAYPVLAFLVFNILFVYAHFPAIYDWLFGTELAHRLTHVVFLATALVRWLPLLSPAPDALPRLSEPGQMLFCFLQTLPGSLVGSLLTLSDRVLYRRYGSSPSEFGITPLADQQLGGLLMWVVEGAFWLVALTLIFYRWADREERRAYG